MAQLPAGTVPNLKYKLWYNPTENQSLRLSLEGYRFLVESVKLTSYKFDLEKPLTNKNLIQLERYFQNVYYLLRGNKIIVFDETEAAMLALHGNDLANYLNHLEINFIDK